MKDDVLLTQYKDAVDKSCIFSKTDKNGIITYTNDLFCQISGYSREELIGKTHAVIRHPDTDTVIFTSIWNTIQQGEIWHGIIKNKKKDGSCYYVNSTIYPIKNGNLEIVEYISIRQDVSAIIKNKKLLEICSNDPITNLPTREKLIEKLGTNNKNLMMILLDIRHMTLMNELYGEPIGNEILVQISLKLQEYLTNDNATLYKLPSDQYVILVEDQKLFEKYASLVEFSFLCDENFIIKDIIIRFHIGVAYCKDELLSKASLALKEAKKRSVGFFIYDNSLDERALHIQNWKKLNHFKTALEDNRIEPFYQPIVDVHTNEIIKYESLARIIDTNGEVIEIMEFLDVARKSSFFQNFTRQIIQKSFALSSASNKEISVNITYENINSPEFFTFIYNRLKMHKGPRITFEILESEDIKDYNILDSFIDMANSFGCQIAIDDFGSGYSNFTHLLKLKLDYIKIDGSIISTLINDENSRTILSIIVQYAKKANIKTIAEFVSSAEIAELVREAGVDYFQGYYCGKPQKAEYYNLC